MLRKRTVEVLRLLLHRYTPITVSQLAQHFGVKERTMRYDLKNISWWLNDKRLPDLTRKSGEGVFFEDLSVHDRDRILTELERIDAYEYVLTPAERTFALTLLLLASTGAITIDDLATRLSVSRSTISRDLEKVANVLSKYKIALKKKPRIGVYVEGSEYQIRMGLTYMLREALTLRTSSVFAKLLLGSYDEPCYLSDMLPAYLSLYDDIDLSKIYWSIEEGITHISGKLSVDSMTHLVLYLAVTLNRVSHGIEIDMPHEAKNIGSLECSTYEGACIIARNLESMFRVSLSAKEIGCIALWLLGSQCDPQVWEENRERCSLLTEWFRCCDIAETIISEVGKVLGSDFKEDRDLFYGLVFHLEPALYRIRFGIPIVNPILDTVRREFPRLFHIVREVVTEVLGDHANQPIPDEEIAYITVHLGAAMYRGSLGKGNGGYKIKVVVVCNGGIGTGNMLVSRLKYEFDNISVVGVISSRKLKNHISNASPDVVVSTVELTNCHLPYVVVDPLLPKNDVERLRRVFNLQRSKFDRVGMVNRICSVFGKYIELTPFQQIQLQKELMSALFDEQVGLHSYLTWRQPDLHELLTLSTVQVKRHATDWRQAIELAATPLIGLGMIETSYVRAMIQVAENYGPYFAFLPGVAIPHAHPTDGVTEVCMSLLTLNTPVYFGTPAADPVDIVIVLGTPDTRRHLIALEQLMQILKDKESVRSIREARTPEAVVSLIRSQVVADSS